MKYIRTKDGKIFDVNEICIPYQIIESWIDFNSQGRFEIIKQGDTIEELCDEFVLVDENYCHDFYIDHYYDDMMEVYEEEKERCKSPFPYPRKPRMLFGAIWTEWGLKYVAKMNDKGELELL